MPLETFFAISAWSSGVSLVFAVSPSATHGKMSCHVGKLGPFLGVPKVPKLPLDPEGVILSLGSDGERLGKGYSWGAGLNVEETTDMTGKTGIGLDVLTWFPPRRCGRNYDISFQYSMLPLTNRE